MCAPDTPPGVRDALLDDAVDIPLVESSRHMSSYLATWPLYDLSIQIILSDVVAPVAALLMSWRLMLLTRTCVSILPRKSVMHYLTTRSTFHSWNRRVMCLHISSTWPLYDLSNISRSC